MARLNARTSAADRASTRLSHSRSPSTRSGSIEPAGSDKENSTAQRSVQKRRSDHGAMSAEDTQNAAKRRRLDGAESQSQRRKTIDKSLDTRYYDPDQDPEERRRTKRALRDLHSKLNDSRQEYLQAASTGLVETLQEADNLFENVKQTADATVDSRLLVAAADLSYKKINTLTLGDSSVGIDVDDFVTKCISFMKRPQRNGEPEDGLPAGTQTQRRRRQQIDEDDDDNGDTMNWAYLGRNACVMYNSRPALSGFLLGPLSVEKKVRQQTQRRAREEKGEPTQRSRTLQLTEEELDNQEKQSLTAICTEILRLLEQAQEQGEKAVSEAFDPDIHTDEEAMQQLFDRHNVTSDASIPLFKFCVNPKSFGQTIENLFYVSFLVKEGRAGLNYDGRGLPTIGVAGERNLEAHQEAQRNQSIFTMSFDIWEDVVESFGIDKCIIPHREDMVYEDGVLADTHDNREGANGEDGEDEDMYE